MNKKYAYKLKYLFYRSNWNSDKFALGSYPYLNLNSSNDDITAIAKSLVNLLIFFLIIFKSLIFVF